MRGNRGRRRDGGKWNRVRLREDSRRGPNQRANAPIHHVTGHDRIEIRLARHVHTPPGPQDRTGPRRIPGDEGSSVRVVADPFGDRCSTGERLLPVRPYEALERAYLPAGRTRGHDIRGRSRSRRKRTRAKTSPGRCSAP